MSLEHGKPYRSNPHLCFNLISLENMSQARSKIKQLLDEAAKSKVSEEEESTTTTIPKSLDDISGEWELVLSTVPHGIFRSSPFFLAIQEAYEYAETKTFEDGTSKPGLFFKLHELQVSSHRYNLVPQNYVTFKF